MPLNRIQQYLEGIYEIEVGYRVEHFLTTDRQLAQRLDCGPCARDIAEKLLVLQDGDDLELSLYLDEELMEFLAEHDPMDCLHEGNLTQFWTALEGVSHFLYLVWNATHGRGISLFELELQAEVDKFIAAVSLLSTQGGGVPQDLHPRLFHNPVFDSALAPAELRRYRDANDYAARYCTRLLRHYVQDDRLTRLVRDLRRFYRLTHRHKLRHIDVGA